MIKIAMCSMHDQSMVVFVLILLLWRVISAAPTPDSVAIPEMEAAEEYYRAIPTLSSKPNSIKWLLQLETRYRDALAIQHHIGTKVLEGRNGDWPKINYNKEEEDLGRYEYLVNRWKPLEQRGRASLSIREKEEQELLTRELARMEVAIDEETKRTISEFEIISSRFGEWDPALKTFSKQAQIFEKLGLLSGLEPPTKSDLRILKEYGGLHSAKSFMIGADKSEILGRMKNVKEMRQEFETEVNHVAGLEHEEARHELGAKGKSEMRTLKKEIIKQQQTFGQEVWNQIQNQWSNLIGYIPVPSFGEEEDEVEVARSHIFGKLSDDSITDAISAKALGNAAEPAADEQVAALLAVIPAENRQWIKGQGKVHGINGGRLNGEAQEGGASQTWESEGERLIEDI